MHCTSCNADSGASLFCSICDAYLPSILCGVKANLFRRIGSAIADMFVFFIVIFIAPMIILPGIVIFDPQMLSSNADGKNFPLIILCLGAFFVGYAFYFIFSIWFLAHGSTPGKWLFDIKVVDKRNGLDPGYKRMLLRETLGKLISGCFLGLGFFWAIWDNNAQTWHDKLSGTVVLYRQASVRKWMLLCPLLGVFFLFLGVTVLVVQNYKLPTDNHMENNSNQPSQESAPLNYQANNSFKWSNDGLPENIVDVLNSPDISAAPGQSVVLTLGVNGQNKIASTPFAGEDDCGAEGCNWRIKDPVTGHLLYEGIYPAHRMQTATNGYYDLLEEGKWKLYIYKYYKGKYREADCIGRDSLDSTAKLIPCN